MGVDIDTYRGRIGSFSYQNGLDVITIICIFNFSRVLKCVGALVFVGLLLIIAGIEQNPGPMVKEKAWFQRVLNRSVPYFVDNLNLAPVLDFLVADEILTSTQARDIKHAQNYSESTRALLHEINTRGESAYTAFKGCLMKSQQHHMVEHLDEVEKDLADELETKEGDSLPSHENDTDSESDNYSDTQEYNEPICLQRDADIERILAKLGLSEESMIQISDVIQIDLFENDKKEYTERDLPFMFLRRLLSGSGDALNYKSYQTGKSSGAKGSVNSIYAPEEANDVSPLDLFVLVYNCCDPMLKQLLFQKLYLAKIAFPLLYKEYPSSKKVLSVWPLRSLVSETMSDLNSDIRETELLNLPVYVVSFARLGRPNFSKSRLLNDILCDSGSTTFFHKDRHLGMTSRYAASGYVEMFFVPLIGSGSDYFDKPMLFLNVRGDLNQKAHFSINDHEFIIRTSDTAVIIIDSSILLNESSSLEKKICRFSSVLLLLASPLGPNDGEIYTKLRHFETLVVNRYNLKLHVVATHKGEGKKNSTDIITDTKNAISTFLNIKGGELESLGTRISKSYIETDESDCCTRAYKAASSVIALIDNVSPQENIIELVTPVQCINAQRLGTLLKEAYRNNDPSSFDDVKTKIAMERQLKPTQITQTINMFSTCMIENKSDLSFLQFYLSWINLLLENKKRNSSARTVGLTDVKISENTDPPEHSDNTYLEIGHLFREIGTISDAILCSDIDNASIGFPNVLELGEVVADLVSQGYTLELLDGDNFLIVTEWIKLVLGKVHKKIGRKQLLTLSVLGVQSSGKSTLLNTMFGLQFPTSSGRSTRGIHMKLIPVTKKIIHARMPFEHVLVIDTEGIRAPELFNPHGTNYKRDNELSTIITGICDITILNTMGESINDIREILQIMAHAFLRLKLANNKLDICKSCFLIHQNVSDMLAPARLRKGLINTVKILDNATKEAAEYEGISDIIAFNQVIEFNPSNVWYLPTLWYGNPPMATTNLKYCERINQISTYLLQKAINEQEKSFKSLEDIILHVDDLWKGVLAEDFVFSFRNSIEKKAFIELEMKLKEVFWQLESSFDDELLPLTQNSFSKCDDHDSLRNAKREVVVKMKNILSDHKLEAAKSLEAFFKENNYKDTTIKWKQQSNNRLNIVCQGLSDNRNVEIDGLYKRREVDIMIKVNCTRHEGELRRNSLELAKELRSSGLDIGKHEISEKFDQIWKTFVEESLSADTIQISDCSLKADFIDCLVNIYESHTDLLNPFLKAKILDKSPESERLSGSFDKTGITKDDISTYTIKHFVKNVKNKLTNQNVAHHEFTMAINATENMFETIDSKILQICQKGDMITSRDVKQLLNGVHNLIEDSLKKHKQHYTLKITFKLKLLLHVSKYSFHRFEKENFAHQQSQGINVRLEIHRNQMLERFYAHLEERKAEDTAATLMHRAIEEFIHDKTTENLSWKIKLNLKKMLPQMKYHLLLDILNEFVLKNDFKLFMSYILNPKGCAYIWVTNKAKEYLFSTNSKMYFKTAESETTHCLEEIKASLLRSGKKLSVPLPSIEAWIEDFKSHCTTYIFPNECFRNVVRELEHTKHVHIDNFKGKILEKLEQSNQTFLDKYKGITEETVRWSGCNPIDVIFEDIWGCPEYCVFCGEPCTKGDKHDSTTHNCMQHRPLGCSGAFDVDTGDILLKSCNLHVASDAAAPCSMIDFRCQKSGEECTKQYHPFKDYKSIFPDWDIEPTKDMEDSSKFWMWFIGKYKEQLGEYFHINTSNVPQAWSEISDEKAVKSLRKLYLGSEHMQLYHNSSNTSESEVHT